MRIEDSHDSCNQHGLSFSSGDLRLKFTQSQVHDFTSCEAFYKIVTIKELDCPNDVQ